MAFSEEKMIIFGAAGAEGQPQTHVQLLINMIDKDMNSQDAVDFPRLIYGRYIYDNKINLEGRFSEKNVNGQLPRGYEIKIVDEFENSIGFANIILKDQSMIVGENPRMGSVALGY
ncbi:MAG: gamma-glutamyltransferase [Thermoplasmata archaeon]|nr:hypothetical protein [Euryarchaeota archaeon]